MSARRVIGVDLGGTKLLAGTVDQALGVHGRVQRAVRGMEARAILDATVAAVRELQEASTAEIEAVGFGIPSLIDRRTGVATVAINLPLRDIAFAEVMAERLGLPVFVDNDGNASVLAEHRGGAARGASEVVMLALGTGIGGGLIIRDELYRGGVGMAGELGHIVIDRHGPRCQGNCPNHGCVEVFASGTALGREARRLAGERPESALARALAAGRDLAGPLVTELAYDGDAAAREALAICGTALGVAIASLLNIFNPQVVVIGGGVVAAGELLLGPARAEVARRVLPVQRDGIPIVPAHFGVEAGMVGAAALAFDGLEGKLL
ncbi:MAG TPA: ROK family protein [Solirubrobacteraceae bacterium]|nr:ROK family protein [Solirubrobacteraceae bacterium]